MLREGKSKGCVEWPPAVQTSKSKPAGARCRNSDSEPEPDGYVPAPTFSQSFSDAIALALEKAVANRETPKGELSAFCIAPLHDVSNWGWVVSRSVVMYFLLCNTIKLPPCC